MFEACSMYMSANKVHLERLKTKSELDFHVYLFFYQLGITFPLHVDSRRVTSTRMTTAS